MNVFNRVLVYALLLLLAAAAVAVAVLAWTAPDESIERLRDAVDWVDRNDGDAEKGILTAIAIGIAVVALAVLFFELKPRSTTEVQLTDVTRGRAVLSTSAVAQRLEEAIRQVPHVGEAKAYVEPKRKGVEVAMDLHVDPDTNLAVVTDAAYSAAEDVLRNEMHVAILGQPQARIFYRELRLRRPGTTTAVAGAAGATAAATMSDAPAEASAPGDAAVDDAAVAPDVAADSVEAPTADEPAEAATTDAAAEHKME
jgi:hypothetical protein